MASRNTELTNGRRTFEDVSAPPLPATERTLCFGPFVLDSASGRLSEGDRPIPLAPKPFEVLLLLARRSGRTVPKNELIEQVWPGAFVADEVLAQSVAEIRRALGDDARTPQYLQTVLRGQDLQGDARQSDDTEADHQRREQRGHRAGDRRVGVR